eukprot:1156297-Pelagomonas_calceolata.AAC.5
MEVPRASGCTSCKFLAVGWPSVKLRALGWLVMRMRGGSRRRRGPAVMGRVGLQAEEACHVT